MKFLKGLWNGIKAIGKQLWSLVSDRQWDFDPYKLVGFVCVAVALIMGFKVFTAAMAGKTGTDLATLAGIVASVIAVGTFLFNQARKSDDTLTKTTNLVSRIQVSGEELQAMVDKAKASIIRENAEAVTEKAPE